MLKKVNIYIILINYNGHKDTIECLESVLKLDYSPFQVLVIDNSQNEDSLKELIYWANGNNTKIDTKFPNIVYPLVNKPIDYITLSEDTLYSQQYNNKVIFIKAKENKGFSAANNIGLKYILKFGDSDDYVWLLNNDTVVPSNTLSSFTKYLKNFSENTGIIGNNLYFYDNPTKLQGYGGHYNSWLGTSYHLTQGNNLNERIALFSKKANYIIGASMFVSLAFIKDVGLMCEDYFLYYEEIDWATMGREKGWEICYCPTCNVYHKEGASIGSNTDGKKRSSLSDYYIIRNRIIFTKKFHPKKKLIIYLSLLGVMFNRLIRKQYGRISIIFKIISNT